MKKTVTATTVAFTFKDGVAPLTFDVTRASPECQAYAIGFGFGHRLGDCAAGAKTEQERHDAIKALITHYESGTKDWNVRTSERAAPINPAIAALAAKLGKSYDEAQAWFNAKLMAELTEE